MRHKRHNSVDLAEKENLLSKKRSRVLEEDEEMLEAEQNVTQKASTDPVSVRAGTIRKIVLKNFMCHENLAIDFNQNINLLVGVNGSGKSAIITALAVGLGAKANSTSRSNNVQQLIKRGETTATVEIYLCNQGADAYQTDVYGRTIVVVRTIKASGGSYRLKNERGKVISSKRTDLTHCLRSLNIQVDNPIVLLNQDAARSFLKDYDPMKLYELFLKATQVDAIIKEYDSCGDKSKEVKDLIIANKKATDVKTYEVKALEERYALLKSSEMQQSKLQKLKIECAWAKVKEHEVLVLEKRDDLQAIDSKLEQISDFLSNKENFEAEINQLVSSMTKEIEENQQNIVKKEDEIHSLNVVITNKDFEINEQTLTNKRLKTSLNDCLASICQIDETVKSRRATMQLHEEKDMKLADLNRLKEECNTTLNENHRKLEILWTSIDKIESESLIELSNKRSQVLNSIFSLQNKIQFLSLAENDTLLPYGHQMSKLVARIVDETIRGQFSELPRGPLGRYIVLSDPKWRNAVEEICEPLLTSFFVNSENDELVLRKLIKEGFAEMDFPTIIRSEFQNQLYDVSYEMVQPQPGTLSLMQIIKINDPVVMNCFIDQLNIETILLAEDQKVAISLTEDAQNIPKNLSKIILLDPFSEFCPAPNFRSLSLEKKKCLLIQANGVELKIQAEIDLELDKANLQHLDAKMTEYQDQLADYRCTVKTLEQQNSIICRERSEIENEITELSNHEYQPDYFVQILLTERQENEEKKKMLESFSVKESENFQKVTTEMANLFHQLDKLKSEKRKMEQDIDASQRKILLEKNNLIELAATCRAKETQYTLLQPEGDVAQEKFNKIFERHKKEIQEAEKIGECEGITKSHKELIKDIQSVETLIKELGSSSKDSIDELEQLIRVKKAEEETLRTIIKKLIDEYTFCRNARLKRFVEIQNVKKAMAQTVSYKFRQILKASGFKGNIEFDWPGTSLKLNIIPRGQGNVTTTNTKALSGGERSFSTVALLISLWQTIDHPFYFLDEYDVFTDQVNRFKMTQLLIDEAEEKRDQFAFLTPQDMSQFQAKSNLTIHRFADPVRC